MKWGRVPHGRCLDTRHTEENLPSPPLSKRGSRPTCPAHLGERHQWPSSWQAPFVPHPTLSQIGTRSEIAVSRQEQSCQLLGQHVIDGLWYLCKVGIAHPTFSHSPHPHAFAGPPSPKWLRRLKALWRAGRSPPSWGRGSLVWMRTGIFHMASRPKILLLHPGLTKRLFRISCGSMVRKPTSSNL